MASERVRQYIQDQLDAEHSVILLDGQAQLALQAADAVMVASGTAALEAALARKPMVVAYRVHAITYFIARTLGLLKAKFFSLPNALARRELVPELEQHHVTPENLARCLDPALSGQLDADLAQAYLQMHEELRKDASHSAARALDVLLYEPSLS